MAPQLLAPLRSARSINITNPVTVADYIEAQWINPTDIFSVLLLLGPEIVRRAVAQLAGRRITPVAFSFGWVAYSAQALLAVFGDGSLMPDSDMANTVVIGAQTGQIRTTKSWLLGKLLHDLDEMVDEEMKVEEQHIPPGSSLPSPSASATSTVLRRGRPWESLRISIYETIDEPRCVHGVPHRDWVWFLGCGVILLQLLIAVIPLAFQREWGTLFITAYGNILAVVEGSLGQWKEEKWACPKNGGATIALTQGNGNRHAIIIMGKKGIGLDLEILARGTRTTHTSRLSRFLIVLLAVNWIALLITASGLRLGTWYLLGIGALGSMQNLIAAAAPRQPSALGVHIRDTKRPIRGLRVADVLKKAEEEFPGLGISLAPVFFPGGMRVQEPDFDFWRNAQQQRLAQNEWGAPIDNLPPLDMIAVTKELEE